MRQASDSITRPSSRISPSPDAPGARLRADENRVAITAAIAALRASAVRLNGGEGAPDFAQLDAAEDGVTKAVGQMITELPAIPDDREIADAVHAAFQARTISQAASQVATYALIASGAAGQELRVEDRSHADDPARTSRSRAQAAWHLVAEHASPRSVWFRNSLRGAAGLAIAVFVAQQVDLQHGFWVALGTLSVLRSNALGTGTTVVNAMIGTAVGVVVGSLLVIAIGTDELVLWAAFPPAVFLAAYAPRAISFAAGQAAFTITVVVLFNLIQPSGWMVGLIRIEDVAIGVAISLGVGLLFWPRGATTILRESLADARSRAAGRWSEHRARTGGRVLGADPRRAESRGAARRLCRFRPHPDPLRAP